MACWVRCTVQKQADLQPPHKAVCNTSTREWGGETGRSQGLTKIANSVSKTQDGEKTPDMDL